MPRTNGSRAGAIVMLGIGMVMLGACGPDIPDECGENVSTVVSMDFTGPSVIETTPDYDSAVYGVTITIEKKDNDKAARVCYVVRDDDPVWKLFWAVDDVLDANFLVFLADETTKSQSETEGSFILWAKSDDEICGAGALPGDAKVEGCSGESEAEVYLQPIGSEGAESPRHKIRLD